MKKEMKLILAGILLLAAMLRIPLTSVGPLIPSLSETTGLSLTNLSQLTSISLLVFAVLSTLVPKISRRLGLIPSIIGAICLVLVGILVRSFTGNVGLYVGTVIIAVGICFGNVLLPTLAKTFFPNHLGKMTSSYTIVMNLMGAIGSSAAIPVLGLVHHVPTLALASVGFLTLPALLVWVIILITGGADDAQTSAKASQTTTTKINIYRSKIAWSLATFMGLQSLIFYTYISWLPKIIESKGYSLAFGGSLLGLMQLMILPASFVVPVFAEKVKNQTGFVIFAGSAIILGTVLLFTGNEVLMVMAVLILGIAVGSAFSLSLILFTIRTKSGQVAAELSGMSQTVGYTLAAVGPVLFGLLVNWTDSFLTPLLLVVVMAFMMIVIGYKAGKPGYID
ncbi:MFS transporter [Weissella viridescens]|uniref:MFS transporter n=1 Tax=Weissella viridescens TaxID=1629 RepID=A0A3P2REP1_WEIVI|nr:MFS transporter [Weissella viridescens]RRG17651.1 MFS transporter [Weissella viridescens]